MPRHYLKSLKKNYLLSNDNLGAIYVKMHTLAWEAFMLNGGILNLDPSDPLRVSLFHVCLAATRVLFDFENGNKH